MTGAARGPTSGPGIALRDAVPDDAMAVAAVHVRSWQVAYRGLLPDELLDAMRPEHRAARYTFADRRPGRPLTMLITEAAEVRGFATVGECRDADAPGRGEVYAIYLDPDVWGRGLGRSLIAAARARLHGCGHTEAVLWVLAGNDRAQRFYRADGWRADGARRPIDLGGFVTDEIRYRRDL